MHQSKRLFSLLLAVLMICSLISFSVHAVSTFDERVSQLREQFPNNKYWNHAVYDYSQRADVLLENWDNSYGDSVTDSPCATHNGQPGYGECDCNVFDGAIQCFGYANRIFYGIFGVHAYNVEEHWDTQNVSKGDWIKLENNHHYAVVLTRSGDWLTIAEANTGGNCKIVWDRQIHISTINSYKHAPNWDEIVNGHTHSFTMATISKAPTRTATGTRVLRCACGETKTETIPAIPYTTSLAEGIYTVMTKLKTGSYIACDGASNAYIWDGSGADLFWLFRKNTDSTYSIENAYYRGKYLTIVNSSMVYGGNLGISGYTGSNNQKFYIIPEGSSYRLVAKHSYMTIDLQGGHTANGTNVQQFYDNGTDSQRWALKASNPKMTLSSTTFSLPAGKTRYSEITIDPAYEFTVTKSISDETVCSASLTVWYDWSSVLGITGKKTGTATVTLTFKDQNSDIVYDTKTIAVTVYESDTESEPPTVSISCTNDVAPTQTVTLSMQDNVGLKNYSWGETIELIPIKEISGTNLTVTETVSSEGCYLLSVRDVSGNAVGCTRYFYKTKLDASGGSVSPASVLTMKGNSFTPPVPTRNGYTFKNWNTKSDGTGTAYTDVYEPTAYEATLYAIWEKNAPTVYTLTYDANGGTGAPAQQTGNGTITLSTVQPSCEGYTFLGWAKSSSAASAQYAPGAAYNLTANTTLYAVWQKNDTPVDPTADPTVTIRNYTQSKTVDYRTTITFAAEVENPVNGAAVHWFVDNKDVGTGETFTVKEATQKYIVQAKYMKDGAALAESETETVNVKTGFFARLKAFFRSLFGRLPKQVQEVYEPWLNFLP